MLTMAAAIILTLSSAALLCLIRSRPAAKSTLIRSWRLAIPRQAVFSTSHATAWFVALAAILHGTPYSLDLEISTDQRELQLGFSAPAAIEGRLRGQLAAWFPDARLEDAPSQAGAPRLTQLLVPEQAEILPLFQSIATGSDPLLAVVGYLSQAQKRAGLCLTIRPAPADWEAWAKEAVARVKAGQMPLPRSSSLGAKLLALVSSLIGLADHQPISAAAAHAAIEKSVDPVLAGRVAAWVEAGDTAEARQELTTFVGLLERVFTAPECNRLVPDGPMHSVMSRTTLLNERAWHVYATSELAALFHLPPASHPLVPAETVRQVSPTSALLKASEGGEVTWLGNTLLDGQPQPFGLAAPERRLHLYVIGKTGTGKSTFLANLARQDLERGAGVGLIDPHGDLAEHVLSFVPPSRQGQVLYFNAADSDYPIGFNLLDCPNPAERPLVASGVVGVFKKLYGDSWGPRLEHFLRNAVLALLETPAPSLLTLPRLLSDKAYRQQLLTHVKDPLLRTFFLEEYERYDPRWRAEAISPILNKVGQFLASPVVRHIVGQAESAFSLRQVMDQRGIFIANLASGRIGEDNSDLLGGLLVAGFQLAAMSRANQREGERADFYLLVDEFQHFANDAFASILSEARKYRLSLTISHQYLAQVPPALSEAVFGNVGSLAAFRIGGPDATRLSKEFAPAFDGQDLVHLPNHHLCVRLALPGGSAPAFSGRSLPPPAHASAVGPIIQASRARWSKPRLAVEADIKAHWTDPAP